MPFCLISAAQLSAQTACVVISRNGPLQAFPEGAGQSWLRSMLSTSPSSELCLHFSLLATPQNALDTFTFTPFVYVA